VPLIVRAACVDDVCGVTEGMGELYRGGRGEDHQRREKERDFRWLAKPNMPLSLMGSSLEIPHCPGALLTLLDTDSRRPEHCFSRFRGSLWNVQHKFLL
jgi:hypothetical protein